MSDLRVLALTRYGDLGAASRYRFLQYIPALAGRGITVDVHALLDNRYVERFYLGETVDRMAIVASYLGRLRRQLAGGVDLLWIEKEAMPYVPDWLERNLCRRVPFVVDFDDAVFHNYEQHRSVVVRAVLGRKFDQVMARATTVVAGNPYISERAARAGARRVEILPTVVDLARYRVVEHGASSVVCLGWIGTPYTRKYVDVLEPVFRRLGPDTRVRLTTIGSGPIEWDGVPVEVRPWSELTEVDELRRLEIGLMPLPDEPFERGKSGLKLIQYMAVGLPVIASPVGVNRDIVEPGVNGFLCETPDEWVAAIRLLAADVDLRRRMGEAGRRKVETSYSLQVTAPRLARILQDAVHVS